MYHKDEDIRSSGECNVYSDDTTPVSAATSEEGSDDHEMRGERRSSDIAIIGLSGRFAGSANLEAFWSHLQAGESCIEPIRREGWEAGTLSDPESVNTSSSLSKWGGMLEDISQFDPLFFNISPLEAARMDPQQRLFLEETYKSFEDAGYSAEQLSKKKVGVFVGARSSDYKDLRRDSLSKEMDAHLFLGNDMAVLAARISYFFNLAGPSLTIDTASSSSLVAIHLACESIRTRESEMALAGGVFVLSSPEYYLMAAKTQMLSPDGKCRTFDKSANGIVLGEGVGALVLKPLDAALADGDHIYGIIKGSAINQDGRTKGMTAPSMFSQKALLVSLYEKAAIHPETVSYIEAHGTGSKLGDPIEVQALTEAFRIFTDKIQFCAIGSHKPNFGHTVMAAGMAGVFKVLLAMKYQQIPPTINVEVVNPQIDFQSSPFFINTESREWKSRSGCPRRAGVSSFGLSGTNCHILFEEPPLNKKTAQEQARSSFFFPFSAKTKAALAQKVGDMVDWLEKEGGTYAVEDLSYTLVQGRSHFSVRSAVVVRDIAELKHALRELMSKGESEHGIEKDKERASQTEPLLQEYGHWLLQDLLENTLTDQKTYRGKLSSLANLYVKGYNLDWGQLFKEGRYHRVPLPTYPFIGESYWITKAGTLLFSTGQSARLLESRVGALSGSGGGDKPQPPRISTDRLCNALACRVSDLLQVRVEEIDANTPLSEYGFDSITFTEFANRLNQTYQLDLTPALFFEYSTLEHLTQYLHATYASVLAPYFASVSSVAPDVTTGEEPPRSSSTRQRVHTGRSTAPVTLTETSPVAIIGMSGAFPQADDVQSLWRNLLEGRDCISEISAERWDWQTYCGNTAATEANKTNIKWAGIVKDIGLFDPLFFGISPSEAEQMDPQQRLLMMYVWKAIEDAGYSAESLSGTNTALFVGTASSGYSERLSRAGVAIEGYSSTGQAPSVGPNRVSYFLNLHGPSEAIDTACSSSLVAIHRGVNAIESGQCTLAIVGGVNTLVSPELHISYSKAGMLSSDGRCKSFSAQANGYVRGEGVGMLVLKKLSDAEQAGDHIYAVIRGSFENHGGHASSLTAPNPRAQADLLIAAYRKTGIDPHTVGYIEAHGTGTPLGDPIEINGLKTAFSELTQTIGEEPMPQAWCGIGSVKSNIGHLELAAGVAGVIKVLLQLQHKTLVKSLHCEEISPYIQLDGSPFYIVQENREWKALQDHTGNMLPRRAGVSSFGFGGANAHVVLEEYGSESKATFSGNHPQLPALIVLSARNDERLHEQVKQLLAWVQAERMGAVGTGLVPVPTESLGQVQDRHEARSLQDLAYTLQVGRSSMEERLAFQANSLAELEEKLRRYVEGGQATGDWYRGRARRQDVISIFAADEDGQNAIAAWMSKGKYGKLLELWVKGLTIDWNLLYTVGAGSAQGTVPTAPALPHRISLPTYPFALERYWIPAAADSTTGANPSIGASPMATVLHPLVQYNISNFFELRFSSTFSGEEFFLADHEVKGLRMMPGVAYLEMARAAIDQAMRGTALQEADMLCLKDVVWAHPLVVGEHPITVHIVLSPQEDGTISFLVSHDVTHDGEQVPSLLCHGAAGLPATKPTALNVDLTSVQSRCQYQFSATECYQGMRSLGLSYGPAHQGIEQLMVGEEEALARFCLPVVVAQTSTDGGKPRPYGSYPLPYVLHPSVLDAALQACIWLLIEQNTHQELQVPFALDELLIIDEVPAQGWALVRQRSRSTMGSVFDIEVCDDEGHIVLRLRGLSTRVLPTEEETRTLLLTPNWKEEAIAPSSLEQPAPIPTQHLVLLCDLPNIEPSRIQAHLTQNGLLASALDLPRLSSPRLHLSRPQRFQDAVLQLIQELQNLLQSRPAGPVLVQVVMVRSSEPSFLEALAGVLKTAQQEYPKIWGQLIEIEGKPEEGELLTWLRENQLRIPQEPHVLYRDGKRWVREWQEVEVSGDCGDRALRRSGSSVSMPWKEGGCYLISGGAGGLARLFVQEIAQRVEAATVILVGRSALSRKQHAQLETIGKRGIHIDYRQVDVGADRAGPYPVPCADPVPGATGGSAVQALIQSVLEQYRHLDGIIHAAGVLRDSLLFNKTPEDVQAVLAPKVIGVEVLDEASREIPLDFFILCSSLTAVAGNVGQADYASANAYLDAFAHARRAMVLAGERHGATVSINWSLWEEGGMQVEAGVRQMMQERLGIKVMGTEVGVRTLYQALACGRAQVTVLHGQVERIKQRLLQIPAGNLRTAIPRGRLQGRDVETAACPCPPLRVESVTQEGQEALQEKARAYFKKQLAAVIKLPVQQIEDSAPLQDYGFDSIMAIRFTNILEDSFGPLSKTLLFEYPTLRSIAEYFLHSYSEQLRAVLGIEGIGTVACVPCATGMRNDPSQTMPQVVHERIRASHDPSQTTSFPVGQTHRLYAHYLALLQKGSVGTWTGIPTAPVRFPAGVGDIAIIGVAGRYPGARDLSAFWENLRDGRDCITEIPPERWDHRLYFDADKNKLGTTYSKWGGFLDGVDEFDPLFFNISPREAQIMDPQERLFLECAFATLEDAGYTRDSWSKPRGFGTSQDNWLAGNVGVFVGVMYEEYQLFGAQEQIQGRPVTVAGLPSWIANRVSYFCNFHGPSMAVDTMCSSSLTAIHLACQSIQHGDCELAIAGGVNVSIHPNKYLFLGQGKFISGQGHCESFGVGADGYVPGEGVGAVLLKPLAQAEADRDHIYGVIKATAINHGGRTNGSTVPNPHAQAEVIGRALKDAGIDPRTISYVEAHGTGTVLGDPIEIAGLTRAFTALGGTQDDVDPGWCAIGSVKSNIGHAESAAGIAGVTKVLLQMRHGQLVPSLHSEMLNPHIDFSATPFVVQQELSAWKRPLVEGRDGKGVGLIPRRAGISSFGAGGSNAHVILEEYMERPQENDGLQSVGAGSEPRMIPTVPVQRSRPALIVLSARTAEQLHERVRQLLAWIQGGQWSEANPDPASPTGTEDRRKARSLHDLSYTLQVGREAMEERLALQVSSLAELEEKLRRFLHEPQMAGDWYRGQVKRYDPMRTFAADEDGQKTVAAWMNKGKYEQLLQWWVRGLTIDWKLLHTGEAGSAQGTTIGAGPRPMATAPTLPRRISLPTYPFAQERYWIPTGVNPTSRATPTTGAVGTASNGSGLPLPACACPTTVLHPLVQYNISDFFEQRFSSTFSGEEFFLTDHVVKGQRVMPGVAYLEMACAAINQAMRGTTRQEGRMLCLNHVVWARPLVVDEHPITVHIVLSPQANGTISFLINRDQALGRGQAASLLCQGMAELCATSPTLPKVDLSAVQERCQHQISATECYQHYRELAIGYGPALQGIERLSIGEGEALARLHLPVALGLAPGAQTSTEGGRRDEAGPRPLPYVLHPSVLDSALQACIGLLPAELQEPQVPFTLNELSIVSKGPAQGWAWVRRVGTRTGASPVPTAPVHTSGSMFDIEVCDDGGHIAVRLRGLSLRMLREASAQPIRQDTGASTTMVGFEGEQTQVGGDKPQPLQVSSLERGKSLLCTPLWDLVVLPKSAVDPGDFTNQVVIVGGTPDEQREIGDVYPHAHILDISTVVSVLSSRSRKDIDSCSLPGGKVYPLNPHESSGNAVGSVPCADLGLAPHIFWLAPHNSQPTLTQESILAAQQQGVMACFRLIKALLQLGCGSQKLRWTVITRQTRTLHATETGNPTHASLLGLFGSLAKEAPQWSIQQVDLPDDAPLPLSEIHSRLPADPQGHGWVYRNGHWYRQTLVPLDVSSFEKRKAYRRGGVYVVIGGAGGIGEVWSEYLIRSYQAQIIWIGRRKIDAGIEAKLQRLADLGPKPLYITADATDRRALQQAYQETKRNFGQIHGVVHSAIVLLDQSLVNMDEERFQAALAAKVEVSVRLAQVFEHEPLDFVLFFSSLNAFTRPAGQSNYAAGCTFEDAFAARLSRDWHCRVKVMNWGYWGSVGVVASPQYRERMAQAGFGSIEPAEAMDALEHLLAGPADQMVFLKTTEPVVPGLSSWREIIQTEEAMTVCPEHLPSFINNLCNYNSSQRKSEV